MITSDTTESPPITQTSSSPLASTPSAEATPDLYATLIQSVINIKKDMEKSFAEALKETKCYVDESMAEIERQHTDQNINIKEMLERMITSNLENK